MYKKIGYLLLGSILVLPLSSKKGFAEKESSQHAHHGHHHNASQENNGSDQSSQGDKQIKPLGPNTGGYSQNSPGSQNNSGNQNNAGAQNNAQNNGSTNTTPVNFVYTGDAYRNKPQLENGRGVPDPSRPILDIVCGPVKVTPQKINHADFSGNNTFSISSTPGERSVTIPAGKIQTAMVQKGSKLADGKTVDADIGMASCRMNGPGFSLLAFIKANSTKVTMSPGTPPSANAGPSPALVTVE